MEISRSLIWLLPQYLLDVPKFAYDCSMAGIFNHYRKTTKQTKTFIQLAKPETTWDMKVFKMEAGVLQVDLKGLVEFGVESELWWLSLLAASLIIHLFLHLSHMCVYVFMVVLLSTSWFLLSCWRKVYNSTSIIHFQTLNIILFFRQTFYNFYWASSK